MVRRDGTFGATAQRIEGVAQKNPRAVKLQSCVRISISLVRELIRAH
jgi:hypothetical protein